MKFRSLSVKRKYACRIHMGVDQPSFSSINRHTYTHTFARNTHREREGNRKEEIHFLKKCANDVAKH